MSVKKLFFIVSSAIILTTRFWGVNTSYILRYSLMAMWNLYFVLSYFSYRRTSSTKKVIKYNFWWMIIPFASFFLYTLFLWGIKSNVTFANFTRLCSTFLYLILSYGYACTAIYLFREKGIDYVFWSGVFSYFCGSVLYLLVTYGFSGISAYIRSLILGENSIANYAMEVHDLTFAMGIFLLYYVFFEEKTVRHHRLKVFLSTILVLFGLKRIEILALFATVLSYYLLIRWGKRMHARTLICAIGAVIVSLVYVYIIDSGILSAIVLAYGIEDSGRLSYYMYASNFYEFSIAYFGTGWTWFTRYFQQLYLSGYRIDGYRIAASIHSDILAMFIEVGFVFFVIWILYMFIIRPRKIARRFGIVAGECVLLLTIYMFILYLTDNTLTYADTQMLFILVPMTVSLKNKDTNLAITKYFNLNSEP